MRNMDLKLEFIIDLVHARLSFLIHRNRLILQAAIGIFYFSKATPNHSIIGGTFL